MHSSDIRAGQLPVAKGGLFGAAREKYAKREVDDLLERSADALAAWERGETPELRGADLVVAQFSYVRFGEGYEPDAMDDYLDEIAVALRRYEGVLETSGDALIDDSDVAQAGNEVGRASVDPVLLTSQDVRLRTFALGASGARRVAVAEVDPFVRRCGDALEAYERGETPELTSDIVRATTFDVIDAGQLGYPEADVRAFVDQIADTLAVRERG